MTRVKRNQSTRHRRKKKFTIVQGCRGATSILYKTTNQQFCKSLNNAFIDRRLRKRQYRNLWICRMNAKVRQLGLDYHSFVDKNPFSHKLNRKIYAQLTLQDPHLFQAL
uniref:50S ribosomal protein L20 n=1 Tax=Rhipilia penicilloides TaxID=1979422 RepID=A0A2P0QHS1_9CHLO|nr:ribosomal protein L20 [Rhipilia penicilloides]ARO74300.1 ribosomal protein L20 [Rhipilia penicilloides]